MSLTLGLSCVRTLQDSKDSEAGSSPWEEGCRELRGRMRLFEELREFLE